ncbi:hypothetical protein Hamer_G022744 [Homarus americanus]|uniref:Uncharacterized protein n=1 Tax=Homarus americanus TaxID=6706 RepID=A0A8J5N5J5_HOMAM|nr:hypothetical protein Hamer_G022744 [Homarus americanus]
MSKINRLFDDYIALRLREGRLRNTSDKTRKSGNAGDGGGRLCGDDCGKGDCATPRTRLASRETQATAAVVSAEVGVVASVRKDDCWKGDSTTHRTRLASRETQATAVVVSAEVGFAASVRKGRENR